MMTVSAYNQLKVLHIFRETWVDDVHLGKMMQVADTYRGEE